MIAAFAPGCSRRSTNKTTDRKCHGGSFACEVEPMRRCAKCVTPDTLPRTSLGEDGVCNHCVDFDRQYCDWQVSRDARRAILDKMLTRAKTKSARMGNWLDVHPAGIYGWAGDTDDPVSIVLKYTGDHRIRIQPRQVPHRIDQIWFSRFQYSIPNTVEPIR